VARKNNDQNPLNLRIRAVTVPKNMTPDKFLRSLLAVIDDGADMPRGVEVELHWRNPATKHGKSRNWDSGEFIEVITDSSPGFQTAVRRMIFKKLAQFRRENL